MCGRYTDTKRDKQFLVRMGIEQAEIDFVPRYNLAPTQQASIVLARDHIIELRRARWGLIPFWAKDENPGRSLTNSGSTLTNARAETVATKPAFRASFKNRRCLVLADGFYEWQKISGAKQPFYIRMRAARPFAFAGLWDTWNEQDSFTIITTTPNELCSKIHDRMPVILKEQDFSKWISPATPIQEVSSLLQSYPADEMESFPVSPLVNSSRTDSEACLQPLTDPAPFSFRNPSTPRQLDLC